MNNFNFIKLKKSWINVNLTDELIHKKIAEFIVSDCQAYHVVEDEGFKALIKLAFPKYLLPGG